MADLYAQVTQSAYDVETENQTITTQNSSTSTDNYPDFDNHTIPYTLPNGSVVQIYALASNNGNYQEFGLGLD